MGRKKQKVRWTSVEDAGFFDSEQQQQQNSELGETSDYKPDIMNGRRSYQPSFQQQKQMASGSSGRRSSERFWSHASLPPRFERSKNHANDYELDSNCETEELPNGFTKIRSKNLDVLFRKDYYAQRMLSTTSSSAVSSEAGEPPVEDDLDVINVSEAVAEENEEEIEAEERAEQQLKEATPPPKEEMKKATPPPSQSKSKINSNATPFYPARYVNPVSSYGGVAAGASTSSSTTVSSAAGGSANAPNAGSGNRPNLFLYSPTSNTMIPCEEIIIPNAIVPGSDVYQGPSNIYLAFPMEGGAPGQSPPGNTSTAGGSIASPGTSSNCTPPQAQSPPNSYAGGAAVSTSYTPTTTPTLVQYDQYGVPYTTYTPVIQPISSTMEAASGSVSSNGGAGSAECSSAESTTHSPPDLSVYNPANWVPDPNYLAAAAAGAAGAPPPYQYFSYYQHQPSYYNFRNGHASYNPYFIESSTVPSSAGESQNEDRSEGEETTSPNTATTTTSNSPKKEAGLNSGSGGGVANVKEEVFIPGLPVNLKRPTKKRRKKKNTSNTATPTASQSTPTATAEDNNVLQAITILQREKSEDRETKEEAEPEPVLPEEPVMEEPVVDDQEPPAQSASNVEIVVQGEGEEEVLMVVQDSAKADNEPVLEPVEPAVEDLVPDKPPAQQPSRPHHRRRRGARKSDKNKKQVTEASLEIEPTNAAPKDANQWEEVPKQILDPNDGWETAVHRKGRPSTTKLYVTPIDSPPAEPMLEERIPDLVIVNKEEPVQAEEAKLEVEEPKIDESHSAPVSRKSTLKRTPKERKKRASLDTSSDKTSTLLSKPVLISDRDFDVASAVAAQRMSKTKSAFMLDEKKLKQVIGITANDKYDTLYISDIGHGMTGGPISLGRFGLGKYVPPDRSDEVLPIPVNAEASKIETIDEIEAENEKPATKSIIKAMMEEVIRGGQAQAPNAAERLTYIRDAERFTEVNTFDSESKNSIPIPDAMITATKKAATEASTELDLD